MSPSDFKRIKMSKNEVRKLITSLIQKEDAITFVKHAFDRMKERNIDIQDVRNILESPSSFIDRDGELENGSYRYRLGTNRMYVILSFNSDGTRLIVVTVMRRRS